MIPRKNQRARACHRPAAKAEQWWEVYEEIRRGVDASDPAALGLSGLRRKYPQGSG